MSCPFVNGSARATLANGVESTENSNTNSVNYNSYLKLDKILDAQEPVSLKHNVNAHDEHLFIIIHQTYELWFKQMIYELDSIIALLEKPLVDDRSILVVVQRIQRINSIWKLLIDQINILETMAPTDFLDFRVFLSSASGFQSLQFRMFENKLGLVENLRIKYNQLPYDHVFKDHPFKDSLKKSETNMSLLKLIEAWLERTPCLVSYKYDKEGNKNETNFFLNEFQKGFERYIQDTYLKPIEIEKNEAVKSALINEMKSTIESFSTIFEKEKHDKLVERGERKLSHKALWGALMIWLNRDEPRFHLPYQLLVLLIDLDTLVNRWRYNHALLTQRQVGSKSGTGGSSGYSYLRSTASDRYKIFSDILSLSTWLIPKSYVPQLEESVRRRLNSFSLN